MGNAVARSVLSGGAKPCGGLAEGLGDTVGVLGGGESGAAAEESAARDVDARGAAAEGAAVKSAAVAPTSARELIGATTASTNS